MNFTTTCLFWCLVGGNAALKGGCFSVVLLQVGAGVAIIRRDFLNAGSSHCACKRKVLSQCLSGDTVMFIVCGGIIIIIIIRINNILMPSWKIYCWAFLQIIIKNNETRVTESGLNLMRL